MMCDSTAKASQKSHDEFMRVLHNYQLRLSRSHSEHQLAEKRLERAMRKRVEQLEERAGQYEAKLEESAR